MDDNTFASGGREGRVIVWDGRERRDVKTIAAEDAISCLAFDRGFDGIRGNLVGGMDNGSIKIWI
jgi:WD40 repeat protein